MNLARAKRRWKAWDRWENQVIALCGDAHKGLPGEWNAHNERATWHNSGHDGTRRARRWNRRTMKGSRR